MEDHLYDAFARLEDTHWWYVGRRAVVRAVLQKHVTRGRPKILDVGSGTGGMLELLNAFGDVEGLEASERGRGHCFKRFGDRITVHAGSLPDGLPAKAQFDVITAFDVIEHLEDPVDSLVAMRQALTPSGKFICTVPAYDFLWSKHDEANRHFRRYTRRSLNANLEAAGFTIEYSSYFNTALFPPVAGIRLMQKLRGSDDSESDFDEVPAPLNSILSLIFSAERFVVPRLRLPFGVSLLAVARPSA